MVRYIDDEAETVAQANDAELRGYLRLRKTNPHLEKSICRLLEKRRRYRRDNRIRVWELDCGPSNGKVLFDDKDEMLLYDPEPGDYKMIWMSGREYGSLQLADWL